MANIQTILMLPGDGIGPEVCAQTRRVIDWLNERSDSVFAVDEALVGGAAYEETGTPLPDATLNAALNADAVLLGAVGGPDWETIEFSLRPERGLLALRKELGLFANLRPAICFNALVAASSLKPELVSGLDIMIVRELTGGIYFGEPRGVEELADGTKRGFNTLVYTTPEIERIARVGFDLARKRGGNLCSVDKANVLECTGLWRDEVQRIGDTDYLDVALSHLYVDNASMQLVRDPKQFDVIVTTNMFGDILSDCAAMLTGSLGMLPSASLGAVEAGGARKAMYEPVHGSAPDIAGQGVANPIATILSLAMMLRYSFDRPHDAAHVEAAIERVLAKGLRTADIMQDGAKRVSTGEMGDAILTELSEASA